MITTTGNSGLCGGRNEKTNDLIPRVDIEFLKVSKGSWPMRGTHEIKVVCGLPHIEGKTIRETTQKGIGSLADIGESMRRYYIGKADRTICYAFEKGQSNPPK